MIALVSHDFDAVIARLHAANQGGQDPEVAGVLRQMQTEIQTEGDRAVLAYSARYDGIDPDGFSLQVSAEEIPAAYAAVSDEVVETLKRAIANVEAFHRHQLPKNWDDSPQVGVSYGVRYSALDVVGLYVPGGRAPLPSTAIMNAVPAKLAGVRQLVMMTPPNAAGEIGPTILVAADLCGVDVICKVGGAQAVFGVATGTNQLPKVDKIVGPGNMYVTLAKQMVYGQVDIDKPAGPSEVLIYVDGVAYASYAAADLLCQLEHDPNSVGVIVSEKKEVLDAIAQVLPEQVAACERREIIEESIKHSVMCHTASRDESIEVMNKVASEHVVILVDMYEDILDKLRHGGSIFCGPYTPVTLGDYYAGPNHVLPTSGTARFASPLGVMDFMKYSSVLSYDRVALAGAADDLKTLTGLEGLDAHYRAVGVRLDA